MSNHTLQNTKGEPIRRWNERSRTRRTHEVPCIAGRNHFNYTEKHTVSCSGFLRKPKPMQHSCSHYNAFSWQQNVTPIMQPLHCDLQPEIQQAHRTVIILRHHPSSSLPSVTTLGSLLLCGILLCDILLCDVLSPLHHPSSDLLLRDCLCYVM